MWRWCEFLRLLRVKRYTNPFRILYFCAMSYLIKFLHFCLFVCLLLPLKLLNQQVQNYYIIVKQYKESRLISSLQKLL
jgi:hypothetical protein